MNYKSNIMKKALLLLFVLGVLACEEEYNFEDQTFTSSDFDVLKVSANESSITTGETGVPAFGLELEIVFTHEVDQAAVDGALSVSNSAQYTGSYDETGSILTLDFETLMYDNEYQVSLPAGTYGTGGETSEEDFSLTFTTAPFEAPDVLLSADAGAFDEIDGFVELSISLSDVTTEEVIVDLAFGGTATLGEDYAVSASSVSIPVGEQNATVTIDAINDELVEGEENIEISIASVENGVDPGSIVSIEILDDDVALGLEIKGALALTWSTSGNNGGKAVHLKAVEDIPDLSVYSIGVANNGGGTDSIEFTLPAQPANAGDDILLAREPATISSYFGDCVNEIEIVIQTDAMNQNGDDAIELYSGTTVIETYGDVNVDGTGELWEYSGSWGYKLGDSFIYGGIDCGAGSTTTQGSSCTYPLCANDLILQGLMSFETDPDGDGNTDRERAIHLRANVDIEDLSAYGIGIANNGGGSDGREMDLPAISVNEGDHILFVRDDDIETLPVYLGSCFDRWDHVATDGGINFNGDDGVELYLNTDVIEVYGSVQDDGTGLPWEYTGAWAYKEFGDTWFYPGANCAEFAETNDSAACSYLFCE